MVEGNQEPQDAKSVATGTEGVDPDRESFGPDGRFKDAPAGKSAINDGFNLWTGLLADRSLAASYAVIAATWAVFGTADSLLNNRWALGAVLVSVLYIGFVLVVNFIFVRLYWKQFLYAKKKPERWLAEHEKSGGPESYWPYTKTIDDLPMPYNWAKLVFPLIAVVLLAVAIILSMIDGGSVAVEATNLKHHGWQIDYAASTTLMGVYRGGSLPPLPTC